MRFLVSGDLHLRTSPPRCRKDDFFETQMSKLRQIVKVYRECGCSFWLQPGDFFDSPRPSYYLVRRVIELFAGSGDGAGDRIQAITVMGQHDMLMHNPDSSGKTAVGVLEAAGVARVLPLGDVLILSHGSPSVSVQGAWFGQEVPQASDGCDFKILVAHASVGDKPLFPGHDLTSPEAFLRNHPGYDLIVLGDYHYRFQFASVDNPQSLVLNMGSMLRLRNTPQDRALKPAVAVVDDQLRVEVVELDAPPADQVFTESVPRRDEISPELQSFIAAIRAGEQVRVSFAENLRAYYGTHEVPDDVKREVAEALRGVVNLEEV